MGRGQLDVEGPDCSVDIGLGPGKLIEYSPRQMGRDKRSTGHVIRVDLMYDLLIKFSLLHLLPNGLHTAFVDADTVLQKLYGTQTFETIQGERYKAHKKINKNQLEIFQSS